MITRDYALTMARYNSWMNSKLFAAAAELDDAQRKADRGAFFKSVHGSLDHLISADTIWLYRFTGRSLEGLNFAEWFTDFAAMRSHREALDAELEAWVASIDTEWLQSDFSYYSKAYQAHYTRKAWLLVAHLFNHQTHHRGQVTTLLSQFGLDVGATDLPAMPGAELL